MGVSRPNRTPIYAAILICTFVFLVMNRRESFPTASQLATVAHSYQSHSRPSFYDVASREGTDKVTSHHYQYMYESRLSPMRDQRIKFLEIGLGCSMGYGPGKSYYTWLEYFPNVDLYYIEYNAKCAAEWANKTTGATIYTGDQADPTFLADVVRRSGGNFDVIVDDGGHTMAQQKTSLEHLWDSVKPGGIYFIEDLGTSYRDKYGGGVGKKATFMEDLKDILDDMNKTPNVKDKHRISKDVVKFDFTREVVALTKVNPRLGKDGTVGRSWEN
ncbi:hard-surface induced protein [Phlyctema vagabunda]|uniref:Hard-surface induced protein n=1 Tax=Phlyctema vagabunda TaxID=108571 RepID=A0ABR4PJL2_9HELO